MKVTHLLEPDFKGCVQHWYERSGLLSRSLCNCQEVCGIFGGKELLGRQRVLPEECFHKRKRVTKGREILEERWFLASAVDSSKALLDSSQPVSRQIAQRVVDPSLLMPNEHQANHSENSLLICHVAQVEGNTPILLPSEPGFSKVLVQFLNN